MKQLYNYNHLVRSYYRTKNKLQILFTEKKNVRKQDILKRRLHKLFGRISSLQFHVKKTAGAGLFTAGLLLLHPQITKAQTTFVSYPAYDPFGLDSIGASGFTCPAFADLDADGDLDMFSGSSFINFAYYENLGTSEVPIYTNRIVDPFSLPSTGYRGAPVFADLDIDGDMDLFVGNAAGNFIYFENTGSAASPVFAAPVTNPFSLSDAGGDVKLVFADLDADGDPDILAGDYLGTFLYFENTGSPEYPEFAAPVENPFALYDVGYRSRPALCDLDADGDFDILCEYGNDGYYLDYFENTGTAASPEFTWIAENPFHLDFRFYPAFADLDNDGDMDVMTEGFTYFQNYGTAESPDFHTFGLSYPLRMEHSKPDFVDIDNDGDMDIISGTVDGAHDFYENTGSPELPAFQYSESSIVSGMGIIFVYASTDLCDLDNDGDFDMMCGNNYGEYTYFQNTGTPEEPDFAERVYNVFGLTSGFTDRNTPAFADLDNDGDFDIMSGGEYGNFEFFRNAGTPESPLYEVMILNPFSLSPVGEHSALSFADLDSDGDQDMMAGDEYGNFYYFENVESAEHPQYADRQVNPFSLHGVDFYSAPTFADLDNDGDLDMLSGSADGFHYYFENTDYSSEIYYIDADGDGFGDAGLGARIINAGPPAGFSVYKTDCDDNNATVSPGTIEICNGLDDNCSGTIDEGIPAFDYYTDTDGDGYGDADAAAINSCAPVPDAVTNNGDCNDADAAINPAATEICNGLDENCTGGADDGLAFTDYFADADIDGYGDALATAINACAPVADAATNNTDCNDADAAINPAATEICNSVDDNCAGGIDDGLTFTNYYPDADLDTYGDTDAVAVNACAPVANAVTNNADCDDADAAVNPAATEIYNLIDDDCDGSVDEGTVAIQTMNTTANQFVIYPNPAHDHIIIACNYTNKSSSTITIKITDATGRIVLETTAEMINGTMEEIIAISGEFEAGIYYVQIQSVNAIQMQPIIMIK